MATATVKELEQWRINSDCMNCVHYAGCRFFMAIALMAKENSTFRDIMMPTFTEKCPMHFGIWKDRGNKK